MIVQNAVEQSDAPVEPLPISPQTVIGVDPGNIGANTTNIGWSVTQKSADGYSVLCFDTENPEGTPEDRLQEIKEKIDALIAAHSPAGIAVEKIEVGIEATIEDWFLYVAGCVATIRSIADQHEIECHLYTPQQVKYIATNNREASKKDVQYGVKRVCNLPQIPEPHHSADAIAASLCYLRSYLNSSRFEGNKRKRAHYEAGCDYLDKKQYETAIDTFKEAVNIDPVCTEAHCGLGRAYLGQGDLIEAENFANETLRLETNHQSALELQNAIKQAYYERGIASLENEQFDKAIAAFNEAIDRDSSFIDAYCGLGRTYFTQGSLEDAENYAEEALKLDENYQPALQIRESIKQKYYEFARDYLNQGALTEAENYANEALKLDENYQSALEILEDINQAYYNQGCDHLNNQRYNEAIAAFKEVIDRDSSFIDAHCQLGRAYLEQGNLDAARKSARAARNLDRNYGPALTLWEDTRQAHIEHGRAALERGELDIAENIANDAQRFYRNWSPVHALLDDIRNQVDYKQGIASLENEQFDEAIAAFNEVIDRDSNFIDAHCGLSRAYLGQRDLNAARESANAALRIDENCQHARQLLMIDIRICSLQIDNQEAPVDREPMGQNHSMFQRLWRAIINRL